MITSDLVDTSVDTGDCWKPEWKLETGNRHEWRIGLPKEVILMLDFDGTSTLPESLLKRYFSLPTFGLSLHV